MRTWKTSEVDAAQVLRRISRLDAEEALRLPRRVKRM